VDYVPEITGDDIVRLVNRDFDAHDQPLAYALLDEFTDASAALVHRVHAAMLKCAAGSLVRLRTELKEANFDWRDVLCSAEYPESSAWGTWQLSGDELAPLHARDWQQYQDWLRR